ncbi:response regulator transcription factor [Acidipila sp. EB88]|uniref:response regulator transcription factor n=1 Tax=Acidipila sp. EB88 TaxID=2305226 RepID=UPI000F5FED72|nr:response regulator transcription factor [Acidipila sp. EB88]RRA50267.1 DNA-binding response regulator [Acidipila sp. EB88]
MRVLVVEDETRLAENIADGLREGPGFAVDIARDGEDALHFCSAADYDLIVLDLMIPRLSGAEVVRQLRAARNRTPVLVLTAVSETGNTIHLLNAGADDYMTKPFDLGELIARARALIRRGKGVSEPLLRFGDLEVHTGEQSVSHGGRKIELSPIEYRILEYLMFRPRLVISKRELLEHLYDFTWEHHSNVIEAHVSNLRKKLRAATEAEVLETLRGRGYRLVGRA